MTDKTYLETNIKTRQKNNQKALEEMYSDPEYIKSAEIARELLTTIRYR